MKKIYHLSSCDTCKRILKELAPLEGVELIDIKSESLSSADLADMYRRAGSYEALFSKRARLYKERGLKDIALEEKDYADLLLEHYTFLKRPVIISGDEIFIGNSRQSVEAAKANLHS